MTTDSSSTSFDNLLAVSDYLAAHGWKVKKSSVYNHAKEGKIRPREDGRYYLKDVEKYARTLKRIDSSYASGIDEYQEEKLKAETDKLKAQAEHWTIRARVASGQYVPRDLFEVELAKRASVFKNDIESFIRAQAMGMIHLVGGTAAKAPDLIEYMLDQAADWLDRYAEEKDFVVSAADDGNETEKKDEEE